MEGKSLREAEPPRHFHHHHYRHHHDAKLYSYGHESAVRKVVGGMGGNSMDGGCLVLRAAFFFIVEVGTKLKYSTNIKEASHPSLNVAFLCFIYSSFDVLPIGVNAQQPQLYVESNSSILLF